MNIVIQPVTLSVSSELEAMGGSDIPPSARMQFEIYTAHASLIGQYILDILPRGSWQSAFLPEEINVASFDSQEHFQDCQDELDVVVWALSAMEGENGQFTAQEAIVSFLALFIGDGAYDMDIARGCPALETMLKYFDGEG